MSGAVVVADPGPMPTGTPPIPSGIPTSDVTDPPTFRLHFPAFADTTTFPDPQVQFFIDMATVMCNPVVWCQLRQMGVELLTAHFLTMQQWMMQGAAGGGVPGMATGIASSKSVSKVSVSYDQTTGTTEGFGPFMYTVWGRQYAWYAQLAGTGGYETLAVAPGNQLAGLVWTYARGVMLAMGS
jgi:hypothetical protein